MAESDLYNMPIIETENIVTNAVYNPIFEAEKKTKVRTKRRDRDKHDHRSDSGIIDPTISEKSSKKLINNRYQVEKYLGQGTYGKVYYCLDRHSDINVAVKTIKPSKKPKKSDSKNAEAKKYTSKTVSIFSALQDSDKKEQNDKAEAALINEQIRIDREVEISQMLYHSNIIFVYDVFRTPTEITISMEFARHGELYDLLLKKGALKDEHAKAIFKQLCRAVNFCHAQGVVHRDIKLENILISKVPEEQAPLDIDKFLGLPESPGSPDKTRSTSSYQIKLADFGFARKVTNPKEDLLKTFCGSILYASPEVITSKPYNGPKIDCWAMGVILYALLYGAMPFEHKNKSTLIHQITHGSFYKHKRQRSGEKLVEKLLRVDSSSRYSTDQCLNHRWLNPTVSVSPRQVRERRPSKETSKKDHSTPNATPKDQREETTLTSPIFAQTPTKASYTKPVTRRSSNTSDFTFFTQFDQTTKSKDVITEELFSEVRDLSLSSSPPPKIFTDSLGTSRQLQTQGEPTTNKPQPKITATEPQRDRSETASTTNESSSVITSPINLSNLNTTNISTDSNQEALLNQKTRLSLNSGNTSPFVGFQVIIANSDSTSSNDSGVKNNTTSSIEYEDSNHMLANVVVTNTARSPTRESLMTTPHTHTRTIGIGTTHTCSSVSSSTRSSTSGSGLDSTSSSPQHSHRASSNYANARMNVYPHRSTQHSHTQLIDTEIDLKEVTTKMYDRNFKLSSQDQIQTKSKSNAYAKVRELQNQPRKKSLAETQLAQLSEIMNDLNISMDGVLDKNLRLEKSIDDIFK